jgi:hypothetical protein
MAAKHHAMNTLNDASLMLLVRRSDAESEADVFDFMQARYDARVQDADWVPLYKIGPTFTFEDLKYAQVQTFAGSLIMRVMFDARKSKFDRPVIYRFNPGKRFKLLNPGGSESEVDETELVPIG